MSNKIGGCVETYTWPSSIPISDQSKHFFLVFPYDSLNSLKLHQMECDSLQYGAITKLNYIHIGLSYLIYEAKVLLYYQNLGTSNHRKPFIFCLHNSQYLCLTRYQQFFLWLLCIMFFFFRKYYIFFKTLLVIDIDISS